MESVASGNAALLKPCGHSKPQADSQLHGVCIFCWRDRGAALVQENARLRERADQAEAKLQRVRDWIKYAADSEGGIVAEIDRVLVREATEGK